MTGSAGLAKCQEESFDLVILDVMLPDLDGFEITRRLRADGIDVPVLFLTARNEVEDLVAGLGIGGDDYVSKPFSLAEVLARAKALVRRRQGEDDEQRLSFADLVMDEGTHEVWRSGQADKADGHGVQPAAALPLEPAPGALQGADHRPRLALRLRGEPQHRRDLRALPAPQARRARPTADPYASGSSAMSCASPQA